MKKLKLFLFTLCLLGSAQAFSQTLVNGIYYTFSGTNATVTSGSQYYTGAITIPATVTYNSQTYSVTTIGERAFFNCSGLISVTIPNSVTSIGNFAFSDCSNLNSVTIPNSVTTIGESTFSGCNGLASVTIPNSVTTIGWYVFKDCSGLTSVTIGNSVTTIGEGVFFNCSGLTSILVDAANTRYSSLSGVLYNKNQDTLMLCPGGKQGTFTIPNSVTTIGSGAFSYCSGLTSVTIPNSVTTIGGFAFDNCSSLTSVTIPNSVTTIEWYAFEGCSDLTSVTIPNSVTTIGSFAFYNCSGLTSVTIPHSVITIADWAFYNCSSLISMTIPNSVTTIGSAAFYNCSSLTSVTIPNSVTTIRESTFFGCSGLTSVTIPNSVTTIGSAAFYNCSSLTEITVAWETPLPISNDVFEGMNTSSCTLKVPQGTKAAYQAAPVWKDFMIEEYVVTGINIIKAPKTTLKVYPNPVVSQLKIMNYELRMGIIYIYDIAGKQVGSYSITGEETTIDISTLSSGVYMLKVGNEIVKVIKK